MIQIPNLFLLTTSILAGDFLGLEAALSSEPGGGVMVGASALSVRAWTSPSTVLILTWSTEGILGPDSIVFKNFRVTADYNGKTTVHPICLKAEILCVYFLSLLSAGRPVLVSILPSTHSLLLNLFTKKLCF